ncbi:MAG TPA: hypothetical protein VGZ23_08840 [bacterium]|nr:hypothetical protein [bacterium]
MSPIPGTPEPIHGGVTAQQFMQFLADMARIVARLEHMDKNIESIATSLAEIEHRDAAKARPVQGA